MEAIAALEILSAGPLTSIQDLGRPGYGRFGVAPGGAIDPYSLRLANLLVGNEEGDAAVEITLAGLKARALTDLTVAVTGADLSPRRDGAPLAMWRSQTLKAGEVLSFKFPQSGCRAYLAIGGRIDVPVILGSRSTSLSAAFGGFKGRPLKAGDIIALAAGSLRKSTVEKSIDRRLIPAYTKNWSLRVLMGPQEQDFSETACHTFLGTLYKAGLQSNHFGIRLEGPVLAKKEGLSESIISEGVVPGAIQVPGNGQPIIILGETVTGGYRKIATVITADLPLLGQIKPGNHIAFEAVSLKNAHQALADVEKAFLWQKGKLSGPETIP